jgi:cupin fold WbuC family metalloprotein
MMSSGLSADSLDALVAAARVSPRRRQHRNIHVSHDDPCQRLLNAIGTDSYIRPHRHSLDPKTETLIAVRGRFALICFDDEGAVDSIVRFGMESSAVNAGMAAGVQVPPGTWHTVLALVPGAILFEVKAGPFHPDVAKEFPEWAPAEGSTEAGNYLDLLNALVEARLE